ncbi:SusE domain-containing protein [Flavobacterium sediminilitoris]|uniref:SusE domain-containing protein n=1 Tax=Flavobacterium sediminilitoris TaxID=2024526 RepID=A0ABY4HS52_9FLAO|nr:MULTISPECIES: SusE domain-containing protein [Flavobacterium]UOX35450.1 SusE domain-containing protein [Flavobacterium sediminilitoris]
MKNIFKTFIALSLILSLNACEDEQDLLIVSSQSESFRIVTPINNESVILNEGTPTNPGISLTWEAATFGVPTEVTYTVQLAPNGSDFSDAQDLGTTNNKFISIPTNQLNLAALIAGATPFVQSAIDIRVKASVGTTDAETVYSDAITYLVTAYGCLGQYAVGTAITSTTGWNWSSPLNLICNDNVLSSRTNLENGAFRFFTVSGDWNSGRNYPYYTGLGYKIVSVLENANDSDSNFSFTGTPGTYRIKIDENQKTISIANSTVSSGIEPTSHWLVGAATPGGWSWADDSETEFPIVSDGIYEVPVALTNNETFRIFLGNNGGDSWGEGSRNFPWYVSNGYTIDSELENAFDGDSNFKYTGPTELRLFKINSNTKTITIE